MTAITYNAKRNIVPTTFSISGTDISILASDDSFNSSSTDLSGLVAGDWVLVTDSAVDDGWHQLSIDSTTTKITTTSTLTDETAGTNISIVGYKHGLGTSYNLETNAWKLDRSTAETSKSSESLSGITETLLLRETFYWDVETDHITEAELPYWDEFISSVRARESFDFDPYGSIAAPDNVLSCNLDGNPKLTRVPEMKVYTMSFKVKVT